MNKEVIYRLLINEKNVIVNGEASTGKTLNVLFPIVDEMVNEKENFIILDNKEEYIAKYIPRLNKRGYNQIIINFKDIERSNGWNPLELPYLLYKNGENDKAIELIELVSNVIFKENNDESFFTNSARDLFTAICLSLFEDAAPSEINLNSINNVLLESNNRFGINDYLTEYFNSKEKTSLPYIYASSLLTSPNDTKRGVISVSLQQLRRFISSNNLSNLLSLTTFEIEDLFKMPSALFIVAKPDRDIYSELSFLLLEQLITVFNYNNNSKWNIVIDNINYINPNFRLDTLISHDEDDRIKFYIGVRNIDELENKYNVHIKDYSNIINTNHEFIYVTINGTTEEFTNEYNHVIFIKNEDDYPKLREKGVNIFNLEFFVKNNKKQFMDKLMKVEPSNNEVKDEYNIDELIRNIDAKIKELDDNSKSIEDDIKNNLDSDSIELSKKIDSINNGTYLPDNATSKIDEIIKDIDLKIKSLEAIEEKKEIKKEKKKNTKKKLTSDLIKFKVGAL